MEAMNTQHFPSFAVSKFWYCLTFLAFFNTNLNAYPLELETLTLDCPDDLTLTVPVCDEGIYLDYNLIEWSSDIPLVDTMFSPEPNTFLTGGIYPATLQVIDINGNIAACTFVITITEIPIVEFPICDDHIVIPMGNACEVEILPNMILEGGPYGCPDWYIVSVETQMGEEIANDSVVASITWLDQIFIVRVTDTYHNDNSCWGQLIIEQPTLPSISCPPDITVFCNQPITPSFLGTPSITGCFPEEDLFISFTDELENFNCPDAYKITRRWISIDPLLRQDTCYQQITAKRFSLQDIVFPPDFDDISQVAFQCQELISFTELADTSITGTPTVQGYFPEHISCDFTTVFTDSIKHLCGESYEIKRNWKIVDWCTIEVIDHIQTILIRDSLAPEFIAPDTIWISSGSDCGEEAYFPPAEIFNECSEYTVEIQTPWSSITQNGGFLLVENTEGVFAGTYEATDSCGNVGIKDVTIVVENEVLVECPEDLTISCNEYKEQFEIPLANGSVVVLQAFGAPVFYNNCILNVSDTASVFIDACSMGSIQRTITTTETFTPTTCNQQITVAPISDFIVEFPADITVECSTMPADFGQPILFGEDCELMAVSFIDQFFDIVPDACYKIIRTWIVVNTCVTGAEIDQETEEVSESQLDLPFPLCDLDGDGDCDDRTFQDSRTILGISDTDIDPDPYDGYITYSQVIKVIDHVPPAFSIPFEIPPVCIDGNSCTAQVFLPVPEVSDCSEEGITIEATSDLGDGFGPFSNVALGTYEITYKATDICGNQKNLMAMLTIEDCKPPTPECEIDVVVEIPPPYPPNFPVNAAIFDAGSFDNCSNNLQFSFSSNPNDTTLYITCDNLGQQVIQLWVTDETGNQGFCETFGIFNLTSPLPCEIPANFLNGIIETEDDFGIFQVEVNIQNADGVTQNITTLETGYYEGLFEQNNEFTITPTKDINPLNGVSTFDLVLITKHVLGTQALDSPYKLIAADVNNSGTITTFDMVELRRLILQNISNFSNNTSWRFVPQDFEFPNPENPFASPFPEVIQFDLPGTVPNLDFIGIKIGDVNGNADPQL